MWLPAFDTTTDTELHLLRHVRNTAESQELKTVSRNPLGNKYCKRKAEALTGLFFFFYSRVRT